MIAPDHYRCSQPRQMQLPIELGQLVTHGLFEPCHTPGGSHHRRDQ